MGRVRRWVRGGELRRPRTQHGGTWVTRHPATVQDDVSARGLRLVPFDVAQPP
jgi:hypothetical protein